MITLVWQNSLESSWECDWIEFLFSKVPHTTITDYNQTSCIDNSIFIYNRTVDNVAYLKDLSNKGIKFGLIHLSDEWDRDTTDHYSLAKFVFRNYYKNLGPKVLNIPLGWMKTFPHTITPKTVVQRQYNWGFSGHVDKTTRPMMVQYMSTIENGRHYFKKCGENWGPFDGHALDPTQMAMLYNDCLFVPCPSGNYSIDTLRVCEALQAGSLPIVERSDYWTKLYGNDHPLIEIDNWSQAPLVMQSLMSDLSLLEQQRSNTYSWWIKYCDNLKNKIKSLV
jgi:hypothetical protein